MLFATAIFAIFLHIAVGERSSLLRAHEYPEPLIDIEYRQITSTTLIVYTRCNSSHPKLGRQCIVTMKIDAFERTAGETQECQVNLKPEMTYGVINDRFQNYVFGRDKVLLLWTETQSASNSEDDTERSILKVAVVHMFDECHTYEASVRKDLWNPFSNSDPNYINVITFNNTFEMKLAILKDDCRQLDWYCNVDGYRLHKFDDRARKVGEAEYWPMPPLNGRYQFSATEAMKFDEPEKGYFVTYQNSTILIELMTKTPSGYHQLQLWKNTSDPVFQWSLANEAIGVCYVYGNASFSCWQSDQKGNINAQMNFSLDVPRKTHLSAVHNLRNGKILLAAPKCSKSNCYKSGIGKYFENFYLMEVDGKSNVNFLEVNLENKCHPNDNVILVRLFQNKQDQYCIVRLCKSSKLRRLVKSRLESSVRCYSSDEFSKYTNCL